MKKIILFSVLAFTMVFHSCNKPTNSYNKPVNAPVDNSLGKDVVMTKTTMTPGQLHNKYLTDYFIANPVMDTTKGDVTYAQVRLITLEMTKLLAAKGIIVITNKDSFTDIEMERMVSAGYFNTNNTLKTGAQILALQLATITNTSIRNTQTNIIDFVGTSPNKVIFGQTALNSLTGLTTDEQIGVNGSGSILGSSYEFWAARPPLSTQQKMQIIYDADQLGYWVGYVIGMQDWGPGSQAALAYAGYKSAICSMAAAAVVAKQ